MNVKVTLSFLALLGSGLTLAAEPPKASSGPSAPVAAAKVSPTAPARLEDYLRLAIKGNGSYREALAGYEASYAQRKGTLGAYMPALQAVLQRDEARIAASESNAVYDMSRTTHYGVGLEGNVPQLGLDYSLTLYRDSSISLLQAGTETTRYHLGYADLTLGLHLLKGFGPVAGPIYFQGYELRESAAFWKAKAALMQVAENVLAAYLDAYILQQKLQATKPIVRDAEGLLNRFQALERLGDASKLSILNARSQLQSLRASLVELESAFHSAFLQLTSVSSLKNELLDYAAVPPLTRVPAERLSVPDASSRKPGELENPDVKALQFETRLQELQARKAENDFLPELDLAFTKTFQQDRTDTRPAFFRNEYGETSAAVTFRMPIGLIQERREAEAQRILAAGAAARLEFQKNAVALELRSLPQTLKDAQARLQEVEAALQIARQRYDASLATAKLGTSAQKDILDYQSNLLAAEFQASEAEARLVRARARYFFLKGDLTPFLKELPSS